MHGQANLASLYLEDPGIEHNDAKGIFWLTKAADKGHAHAQYMLGVMYFEGDRITKDLTKAERYLRRAAKQKHQGL